MIVISKGNKKKKVSLSAYNEFFKSFGWKILNDEEVEVKKDDVKLSEDLKDDVLEEIEENDEEDWDNIQTEEYEKPLSEMNRSELLEKASSLNIDVSDCTTNKQIKERIKQYT